MRVSPGLINGKVPVVDAVEIVEIAAAKKQSVSTENVERLLDATSSRNYNVNIVN